MMTFSPKFLISMTCLFSTLVYAEPKQEKLSEDPTKVVTKIGIGYRDNYHFDDGSIIFSGSLALDEARKINASINDDGTEWKLGGSWLFDVGIVNFRFAKNTLENDTSQTSYSVGTFIPLSVFGIEPYGIQIFPMAGYTYTEGEVRCDYEGGDAESCGIIETPSPDNGFVFIPSNSNSGYLGAISLKPFNKTLTGIAMVGAAIGSDDYSGYWVGGGLNAAVNDKNSFTTYTYMTDNSFGSDSGIGLNYLYEFK